jgi:hypothetical protein
VVSLTKLAERGVSSSGLSMPNTVLLGRVSIRPALSRALTTISSTAVEASAGSAGRIGGEGVTRRRDDGQGEQNSDGRSRHQKPLVRHDVLVRGRRAHHPR